jgi:hypothetical protein
MLQRDYNRPLHRLSLCISRQINARIRTLSTRRFYWYLDAVFRCLPYGAEIGWYVDVGGDSRAHLAPCWVGCCVGCSMWIVTLGQFERLGF